MSLLWMEQEQDFQELAEAAFAFEQSAQPEYYASISKKVMKIIRRDTRYNIDFLYTAYELNDEEIMRHYCVWLFQLMRAIFQDEAGDRTMKCITIHLDCLRQGILSVMPEEKQAALVQLVDAGMDEVHKVCGKNTEQKTPSRPAATRYEAEIREYLDTLFQRDPRKVMLLIHRFADNGIPLDDIYADILTESMYRIGDLWHESKITVDTEHYCTSLTQTAMMQLYPMLFSQPRKDHTILCACPGAELHEIGAHMVSDIFENDGWDSVYLGAAVPEDALLQAIRDHHPSLVALSVTMPQFLLDCRQLIDGIRGEFPDLKIAVGGNAFKSTKDLWTQWPIDFYTRDARELLAKANAAITH